MATITDLVPLPTPEQAPVILARFVATIAAIVTEQVGEDLSARWMTNAAFKIADYVDDNLSVLDTIGLYADLSAGEQIATSVLFQEIVWFNRLYATQVDARFDNIPADDRQVFEFIAPAPSANIGKAGVERAEVIHNSIEKLFEKLPTWLKKLMHVAMELLKLARGITD